MWAVLTGAASTLSATYAGAEALLVIEAESGKVLHQRRFRARIRESVNAATPLATNDQIFISA